MQIVREPKMLYDVVAERGAAYFAMVYGKPAVVVCLTESEFVVYNEQDPLTWPESRITVLRGAVS